MNVDGVTQIVVEEGIVDTLEFMARKIVEEGTIPFPFSHIKYDGSHVMEFVLDEKKYVLNQDATAAAQVCANIGEVYEGQSLSFVMHKLIEEQYPRAKGGLPKSTPNPHVMEVLTQSSTKDRAHYGLVGKYTNDDLRRLDALGRVLCCDINKCHPSVLYQPEEPWALVGFNDDLVPYDGEPITFGFYEVLTDDYTVLKGDRIYSSAQLKYAREEGVKFEICA